MKAGMEQENTRQDTENAAQTPQPENAPKGKWFGRGIYGSKDVPIRILDGFIVAMIAVIVVMIVFFAVRGGFQITYDTQGGSEVAAQKVRYGELVPEPEEPYKPGFTFDGWYTQVEGETVEWQFLVAKVSSDMTLTAHWTPAQITVKFDYAGGTSGEGDAITEKQVTFAEVYGELPIPVKEGASFGGWEYSGQIITEDTTVQMTGEHILTAIWQ